MMKILIKRSKKDVLSQSKEYHTREARHYDTSQKQLLFTSEHLYESKEYTSKSLFIQPVGHHTPLGETREKILTLNHTKEIIKELYQSKKKYDELCKEHKAPIETMEQYLYSYLNNKYGLKPLIIEWTVGIVNAIKLFKDEDHDVYLFAKILKNRCEEDFVESQQQVRDTLNAILKMWAREKYIYKPDYQIDLLLPELKTCAYSLEFYIKVLEKLYPEERDRVYVEMHLEDHLQRQKTRIANNTTFAY